VAEIETWHTDKPTCPHCGHVCQTEECDLPHDRDYWEGDECEECGQKYSVERNISVTYTTRAE
jgi:hypothetical protein